MTSGGRGKERSLYIPTARDYSVNSSLTTLDVHLSPDHASSSWRKPHSEQSSADRPPPLRANGVINPASQQRLLNEQHAAPEQVSSLAVVPSEGYVQGTSTDS